VNVSSDPRRRYALALAATTVAVLGFALAGYAAGYFFLFDDFALIELARTHSMRQLLAEPLIGYYRPLPFLLLRAETFLFGWDHPAGYMAVNLLGHVTNAALCAWLTALIVRRTAVVAFVFVLASPWATEGFLWMSGIFDLWATMGVLAAVIGVRLTIESRTSRAGIVLAGVGTLIAVFSKENAVVIPALAAVVVLIDQPPLTLFRRDTFLALTVTALPVLLYLVVRAAVIGMLAGAYGDFGSLWRQAPVLTNIYTYFRALIWIPLPTPPPYGFAWSTVVRLVMLWGLFPIAAITLAVARPRLMLGCLLAFLIATLPVCWFGMSVDSTVAGRYAYLPVMPLAIAFAAGFACLLDRFVTTLTLVPLAAALVAMSASMLYQTNVWTASCQLARGVMEQLEPYRGRRDVALELQNVPFMYVEGPYVLKAYAFRFYGDDRRPPLPPVKAHGWTVKYAWNSQPLAASGIDPTSDYLDQPPAGMKEETVRLRLRSSGSP
jgi:hypothetical protein